MPTCDIPGCGGTARFVDDDGNLLCPACSPRAKQARQDGQPLRVDL